MIFLKKLQWKKSKWVVYGSAGALDKVEEAIEKDLKKELEGMKKKIKIHFKSGRSLVVYGKYKEAYKLFKMGGKFEATNLSQRLIAIDAKSIEYLEDFI